MKIAHVVTYISPDGAFGGPVRVALGQAEALAARGHDVTVYSAAPAPAPRTVARAGYTLKSFPAKRIHRSLGFAGMYAPGLVAALVADLPHTDVVHIHLARDLVTLPASRAARKAGTRLVLQPHGMIDRSTHPLAAPIDAWEVKRSLAAAHAVLTLTDREQMELASLAPSARFENVRNGIKIGPLPPYEGRRPHVLYLARLHARKRPVAFVEAAVELLERGVDARFTLAGPDEGEGPAVMEAIRRAGVEDRVSWIGPVDPEGTDDAMRDAQVFVLPSVGEVFPMTVLEAFAAGTPVVTTSSLGIASRCRHYSAAVVTDGSIGEMADGIQSILDSPDLARALREGARNYLDNELSVEAVADDLLRIYGDIDRAGENR